MPQHCKNAQRVAEFLHDNEQVAWVHYCGLPDDANYERGKKYLPNNLIHRLMIRGFADLDTKCVWRTGARFQRGESEALAEMDENALNIYVRGEHDSLQYLAGFRVEIHKILNSMNLHPEELICYSSQDGKEEGYISYHDVMRYYHDGIEKTPIPGMIRQEYPHPAEILKKTYINWRQEAENWSERGAIRDIETEPLFTGTGEKRLGKNQGLFQNFTEICKKIIDFIINFIEKLGVLGKFIVIVILLLAAFGVTNPFINAIYRFWQYLNP